MRKISPVLMAMNLASTLTSPTANADRRFFFHTGPFFHNSFVRRPLFFRRPFFFNRSFVSFGFFGFPYYYPPYAYWPYYNPSAGSRRRVHSMQGAPSWRESGQASGRRWSIVSSPLVIPAVARVAAAHE